MNEQPQWLRALWGSKAKRPLPILGFPAATLLGVSVNALVRDSALQAEGMLRVAARTDPAAVLSLMDLSVEAECFGASVRADEWEVPTVVGRLVSSEEEAEALPVPRVGDGRSGIFVEAVRLARARMQDRPILAGMIGPFSLAARLLDVSEIMMDCYDEPTLVHTVLEKATAFLLAYGRAFKEAGADGVMLAEPVAGLLSPALERDFSAPYVRQIIRGVQDARFGVLYHNCGGNTPAMTDSIFGLGAAGYHFGNAVDLTVMLERAPADALVMGNLDPAGILRTGSADEVAEATRALRARCGAYPGFVISSGCDMPYDTPWENIDAFFAAATEE